MRRTKETIQLEKKLTSLLGKKFYTCTKHVSTGKWYGRYDYCLRFNDGTGYFISNGMKLYEKKLTEFITQIEYFISNRNKLEEWIKEILKVNDKKTYPVTNVFDKLYLITDDTHFGKPAFDFHTEQDGVLLQSFTFLETSFCSYCLGWNYEKYIEDQQANGFSLEFGTKTLSSHPEKFI